MAATITNPVVFVRGSSADAGENTKKKAKLSKEKVGELSGTEARSFYEQLFSEENVKQRKVKKTLKNGSTAYLEGTNEKPPNKITKRKCRLTDRAGVDLSSEKVGVNRTHVDQNKTRVDQYKTSDPVRQTRASQLLKSSQEGDVEQMVYCLQAGVSVDVQDAFGWTPIMCAVQAHQVNAMQVLLHWGADLTIRNAKRMTVRDIIEKLSGHWRHKMEEVLFTSTRDQESNRDAKRCMAAGSDSSHKQFYCSVCNRRFCDISQAKHETSTVHLFNLKLEPKGASYGIPESNRGFQMLVRSGWDAERGLGSKGQGQQYPVKTVLKRDRKGLGMEGTKSAKVTHFNPRDSGAIKNTQKLRTMRSSTLSKRAHSRKERREKQLEVNFRREFTAYDALS